MLFWLQRLAIWSNYIDAQLLIGFNFWLGPCLEDDLLDPEG
jgi:hypothetical protein